MARDLDLLEMVFDHLCEHHPEVVAELDDSEIRRRSRAGVERAVAWGLTKDGTIAAYVALLFVVGPAFDEQPGIRRALEDKALPPDERVETLFAHTSEQDWEQASAMGKDW
jgi:hypothetical protein